METIALIPILLLLLLVAAAAVGVVVLIVALVRRKNGQPSSVAPVVPALDPEQLHEERTRILDELSAGRLTSDEAGRQLDELTVPPTPPPPPAPATRRSSGWGLLIGCAALIAAGLVLILLVLFGLVAHRGSPRPVEAESAPPAMVVPAPPTSPEEPTPALPETTPEDQ